MLEMFTRFKDEQFIEDLSKNVKRGLADIVGLRDTDPYFRLYNPDWPLTGGYLSIFPGKPPNGFVGQTIQIGV
jgi:hypothetical protein